MSTFKKISIGVLVIILIGIAVIIVNFYPMYKEMQVMKMPKYEIGKHKGAKFCSQCHQDIYEQWSKNSRHATAHGESFHDFRKKVVNNFMINTMMGEEMCYACHGSKEINEGVNCETCHGIVNASDDKFFVEQLTPLIPLPCLNPSRSPINKGRSLPLS